jgi:hypothetical protein
MHLFVCLVKNRTSIIPTNELTLSNLAVMQLIVQHHQSSCLFVRMLWLREAQMKADRRRRHMTR